MRNRIEILGAMAVVALGAFAALGDSTWKAAVDGAWETSTNWSPEAVPTGTERALITPSDNAYTVTVSSVRTVGGLDISGITDRPYGTRLSVNAPLTIDGGTLLASYGEINIGPSGSLELKNQTSAYSQLFAGARIVVDGGTFAMTNGNTKALYIGDTTYHAPSWGPSAFVMNSGNAYFAGSAVMLVPSASWYCNQVVLNGGRLELIDTSSKHNVGIAYFETKSDSDVFIMGGNAEMVLSNGGGLGFGRGISTFRGNSKLSITSTGGDVNYLTMGPYSSDSGRTATINISENATLDARGMNAVIFGKSDMRTGNSKGYLNVSGGTATFGIRSNLGNGTGIWEMNQTGGTINFVGYGLRIGGVPSNLSNPTHENARDMCCTSTVTVAGGTFNCEAANSHGTTPNKGMWGMVVGAGLVGTKYQHLMNGWTDARLVLRGAGTISCGKCVKIIGIGKAVASVTQSGGTFTSDCADESYNRPRDALVIGAFGGRGTYEMSGGTATMACPLYVGGTTLSLLQRNDESGELPADTAGTAEGTLRISGGTMSFAHHGVVGLDGSGTIELSGNGSLTIGDYLTLTNSAVAGSQATIKVVVSGEQAPTFRINGPLNVNAGSKLVVDATGFTGESTVKLIDCTQRNGDFADGDIEIVGGDFKIRQSVDGCVYLVPQRGLMMILK